MNRFLESGGDKISFKRSKEKGKKQWFYFWRKQLQFGVTNCASGRSNIINTKVFLKKGEGIVISGDGTKKHYKDSHLFKEMTPSGNMLLYSYDGKGRLEKITAKDGQDQVEFGWMHFSYLDNKVHVTASNGKEALYTLSSNKKKKEKNTLLKSAQVTGLPSCQFIYSKNRLQSLEWEDGNILSQGKYLGKGKALYFPDKNGKLFRTHKISYHKKRASVEDSEGGKTVYHFSRRKRLNFKERKEASKTYSTEIFYWREKTHGEGVKKDEGNLITKAVGDHTFDPLTLTTYRYDQWGNVLEETVAGHLTGYTLPDYFEMDPWGRPYLQGRESYSCRYTYTNDGLNLPLSLEEEDGLTTTWSYLQGTNKPLAKLTYAQGEIVGREFFAYNELGLLIERINDDGKSSSQNSLAGVTKRIITRIDLNILPGTPGFGKPLKVSESYWDSKTAQEYLLKSETYTYGMFDLVTSVSHFGPQEELLYILSYAYDASGNKIQEIDPEGRVTLFAYNKAHLCTYKERLGSGLALYYTYDNRGNLLQEERRYETGDLFVHTYEYDTLGRKTAEINPYGGRTTYTYDSMGRLTQIEHPSFMGKEEMLTPVEKKKYNIWDQVIEEIDAAGFATKKSYNARGQVTEVAYPDGSHETYRYHLNGTLEKKIHPNGSYTLFTYDALRHPIKEETYSQEGTLLRTRQFLYQGDNLILEIDPAGNPTTYEYDGAGRRTAKVFGGFREEYFYDAFGKLFLTKKWYGDAPSEYISYIQLHDPLGRLIEERIEDSKGVVCNRKTYAYDLNDHRIEEANYQEEGRAAISYTRYAPYNLPLVSIDPLGIETHYYYDFSYVNSYGQQVIKTTITAPNGVQTIVIKDPAGRDATLSKISPMGELLSSESIYYDSRGLKELHVAHAVSQGKKLREYWVSWTYDSKGRPVKIQEDPLGKNKCTRMAYNPMGALQTKTKPDGTVITYEYDSLGRETALATSDGSICYTYTYDLCDQLIQSKDSSGNTLFRSYDVLGNLISETLPNGLTTAFKHDGLKRLTCLTLPDASTVTYEYGPICLRSVTRGAYTHQYNTLDWQGRSLQSTLITGDTVDFTWNLSGRLQSMKSLYASEVIPEGGYDLMGNLLHVEMSLPGLTTKEKYRYDLLNQLIQEETIEDHAYTHDSLYNRLSQDSSMYKINDINQIESDGKRAYTYDLNGNLLQGNGISYQFDALNRLISYEKAEEWKSACTYDSFGRRITVQQFQWEGEWVEAHASQFFYQGVHEIGSFDETGKMKELRVLGKKEGSLFRTAIAIELSGIVYAPLYDHRFNVIALIDKESKEAVEVYRYAAFGKVQARSPLGEIRENSLIENPWLFASQRRDFSGLYCIGKRFYNVDLGRWISPDPGNFIDGLNLYAYTHNRPLISSDYFGFSSWNVFKGFGSLFRTLFDAIGQISYHSSGGLRCGPAGQPMLGSFAIALEPIVSMEPCKPSPWSSFSGKVGGEDFPGARVRVVTGIWCFGSDTIKESERVSSYLGGRTVYYTCNQTHGYLPDLFVAAIEYMHVKTQAIDHLTRDIENDFKEMERIRGTDDGHVYLLAHSRGGLEVDRACARLDPDMRDRLRIITFGSAKLIPESMCKVVGNVCNPLDIVNIGARNWDKVCWGISMIGDGLSDDGFKYTSDRLSRERVNVTHTGCYSQHPLAPIYDHFFNSEGYDKQMERICNQIIEKETNR